MKAISRRLMSAMLILAMLAVYACGVMVPAMATENQQYTLYFENADQWEQVYVYYWSDDDASMVEWPGEPTVLGDDGLYCAQLPGDAQHVIFNNQGQGIQTDDLSIPGTNYIYSWSQKTWYAHSDCEHSWKESVVQEATCAQNGIKEYACEKCEVSYQIKTPTLDHSYTDGVCSVCGKEAPASQTVYFDNTDAWTAVNAYYWCSAPEDDGTQWPEWPGVPMTLDEETSLYSVQIPLSAEYIIFNDGTVQTDDLLIPGPDQIYSYETGLWEEVGGCKHQWNDGLIIWPLTCTQDGVSLYSCTLCGDTYEDYRYATGHKFEDGVCLNCGEPEPADVNVYFDNALGWEQVYVYFWSDSNIGLTTWPGVEMTAVDGGYSAQISGETEFVIFNSGPDKEQSHDMWLPGDGFLFCMFSMEWKKFEGCFHSWQQTESENPPTCSDAGFETYTCSLCDTPCAKYVEALGHNFEGNACVRCGADINAKSTVYFDNAEGWEDVYIYFWSSDNIEMTVWPGIEMTAADGGYSAQIPAAAQYVIFSDGTNLNQTTDMWVPGDGWFYCMFTDDWAEFDGCFHDWAWNGWTYEPGCVEFGFSLYSCRDCALSCGRYASPLGHDYADGQCLRCGYAEPEMNTVYFDNTDGWENVYVYYWPNYEAGYDSNWYFPEWPGQQMTHVKDSIYSVEIPVYGSELNFTDGRNLLSDDLTVPGDGYVYSWENQEWTEMTVSQNTSITGSVTSFLDANGEITVTLSDENGLTVVAQTVVTGNTVAYTLENVASGTYTLVISKAGHTTRSYTVAVEAEVVTLDVKLCPVGDINGDGRVNIGDTGMAYTHVKGSNQLADYAFDCADINGDGKVNIGDVGKIYAHVKGTTPLW